MHHQHTTTLSGRSLLAAMAASADVSTLHDANPAGFGVHHNPMVTAFIGAHQWPNNHGNVLVVPNEHVENLYDLPVHFASPLHALVRAIALAMETVYTCDGISTRQHNEPAGNQDVWHYHVHVTPRYKDDGLYPVYTSQRALMPPSERAKHAQRLRAALAEWL